MGTVIALVAGFFLFSAAGIAVILLLEYKGRKRNTEAGGSREFYYMNPRGPSHPYWTRSKPPKPEDDLGVDNLRGLSGGDIRGYFW